MLPIDYSMWYKKKHQFMPKAQAAADKVVQLSSSLAPPYAVMVWKNFVYDWNGEAVRANYNRAIQLNPKYGPTYYWYTQFLAAYEDDPALCLEMARRGLELDPLSPIAHNALAVALMRNGKYEAAIDAMTSEAQISKLSLSYTNIGLCYLALDNMNGAMNAFMQGAQLSNDNCKAYLIYCYVKQGKPIEARVWYDKLISQSQTMYTPKSILSMAEYFIGNKDIAHELLKKAFDDHDILLSLSNTLFSELCSEPRNAALFRKYLRDKR